MPTRALSSVRAHAVLRPPAPRPSPAPRSQLAQLRPRSALALQRLAGITSYRQDGSGDTTRGLWPVDRLRRLQATAGNRATAALVQRACACATSLERCEECEREHGSPAVARLQRTPARKVSCAPGPLNVPGGPTIADPVAVITAAEDRANEVLDAAIGELDFTIRQIADGAGVGWPTISDSLAHGLRIMGLDPDDPRVWSGRGIGSARLLLRRLRLIRGTIGTGSFFFTCIGPASGTIGRCSGTICGGGGANAASCGGSFRINFCAPFWSATAENQAETLLHESCHNFADFIQDSGREGNAGCYSRFAQIVAGVDDAFQRADLCPDP